MRKVYEGFSKEFTRGFFTKTVYAGHEADIDFMNESHTEWIAPWDARYTYTDSVDELFEKGIQRAVEIVTTVFDSFNGGETTSGGNSFMTGIAWNAPLLLKFYEVIFKDEEAALAPKIEELLKKIDD